MGFYKEKDLHRYAEELAIKEFMDDKKLLLKTNTWIAGGTTFCALEKENLKNNSLLDIVYILKLRKEENGLIKRDFVRIETIKYYSIKGIRDYREEEKETVIETLYEIGGIYGDTTYCDSKIYAEISKKICDKRKETRIDHFAPYYSISKKYILTKKQYSRLFYTLMEKINNDPWRKRLIENGRIEISIQHNAERNETRQVINYSYRGGLERYKETYSSNDRGIIIANS